MDNREIRALALKRRKTPGLSGVILLWFAVNAALTAPMFATTRLGVAAELALDTLISLVCALVASTGLARVSVAVWNGGPPRVADLFAYAANRRLFARGLAVALLAQVTAVAFRLLRIYADFLPGGDAAIGAAFAGMALAIVNFVATVCAGTLFYAIEAAPDEPLRALIPRALKLAFRNFWRFVGMSIATAWVPFALLACGGLLVWMLIIQLASALTYALVIGGMSALLLAIVWVYGPYVALSYAGLAAEVFGGRGDAA